jgi:hypothetical protein
MFLQSYVTPICLFVDEDGIANLRKLIGTAFFVGRAGYYLTARHVLEQAFAESVKDGREVGLVVKGNNGELDKDHVVKLNRYEFAPRPFDIAAGWVKYHPHSPFKVKPFEVHMWQEVAALGYPESASIMDGEALWMNLRGYRGHIQRPTVPRDMPSGRHPNGFELDFLLGPGSSGGPVFTPDEVLIGVGVGSFKSEHLDEAITEIDDDGKVYREQRVRIEQFGFAHDISGLLDWRAEIFGGASLQEVAAI